MNEGVKFVGKDNGDMVEFLQYVRERGGQCVCIDYEGKVLEIIRGTINNEKVEIFSGGDSKGFIRTGLID